MVFHEDVTAITNDVLLPGVVDTVSNGSPLLQRALRNMKTFRGPVMKHAVKIAAGTQGGFFSGLEKFSMNIDRTKVNLSFEPKAYQYTVAISGLERDANSSVGGRTEQAIGLIAERMEEAKIDMSEELSDFFYADGTDDEDSIQGLAAIADDGGEVATYGGQSRSTYTTLQAYEEDVNADITAAKIQSVITTVTKGNLRPTIILTTKAIWNDFAGQHNLNVNSQYTKVSSAFTPNVVGSTTGRVGDLGFTGLEFAGVPILWDESCPSGKMYLLNENDLAFYALKSDDPSYSTVRIGTTDINSVYNQSGYGGDLGFQWSGWTSPTDQYAAVGYLMLLGEYISFNPRLHAALNGITVT